MQKVTLIHHPTVALRLHGHADSPEDGMMLGHVYKRVMPASLANVAGAARQAIDAELRILDLRAAGSNVEQVFSSVQIGDYRVEASSIGASFDAAKEAIAESDLIGLSSHFTYESDVVRQCIEYAKSVNRNVQVMVGGADVKARPNDYQSFGADFVFTGDFNPSILTQREPVGGIINYTRPLTQRALPALDLFDDLGIYTDTHDGDVPEGVSTPVGFLNFTRGCPRECDFCEIARSKFESLDKEAALALLRRFKEAGISTLNFTDDNLLIWVRRDREAFLEVFETMRDMGFAWEFPNGLEIGLLGKNGQMDEELISALFANERVDGRLVGAYRCYIPIETFDKRDSLKKLKPIYFQNELISRLVGEYEVPELDFGVIIPPDADLSTFRSILDGYSEVKALVDSGKSTKGRYSVFHLIPIAKYRSSLETLYTVDEFAAGRHFYLPVYDGDHLSAQELLDLRLNAMKTLDPVNYESLVQKGRYSYG